MPSEFNTILPRLKTVLDTISLDGDSGRTLSIPRDYPQELNTSSLPVMINRIQPTVRLQPVTKNERRYSITVSMSLYLVAVGTHINLTSQYDLYSYWDKLEELFVTKAYLEDANSKALDGVFSPVTFSLATPIPTILSYPDNLANAPQYIGVRFNLVIPFSKIKVC